MIVDAGVIIGAANRRDSNHRRCAAVLEQAPRPLKVPELVVAEVGHILSRQIGAHGEPAIARQIAADDVSLEPTEPSDWGRIAELAEQYLDLPLGLVDAAVITIAERLHETTIATLDRAHFTVVQPRHVHAFELVP